MKKILTVLALLFLMFCLKTSAVSADGLGVGIGTGKIQIEEELRNGMTYKFPDLVIINTGDKSSNYTVDISYDQNQKELLPPVEWFTFTPEIFFLEPGETQKVQIRLKVPVNKVIPGDYFGYLEAKPIVNGEEGESTVGISVAAKLRFTIAPSNFFQGVYYMLKEIFVEYQPWTTIAVSLLFLFILRSLITKFFSFKFDIKLRKKENQIKNE